MITVLILRCIMVKSTTRKSAKSDRRRYNRIARFYDLFETPMELMNFRKWRKMLFDLIKAEKGLVLEIGAGTGKNIPNYPSNVVALDISEKMLERAVRRAKESGKKVDFMLADAENLPFRSNSFDVVFTTFVFCSVDDPV